MGDRCGSLEKMVKRMVFDFNFYNGKRVFITGHTGFKGSWLCFLLNSLGAEIYGYSLLPSTTPSLYKLAMIEDCCTSTYGDIRDFDRLYSAFSAFSPEIVIHLAAQPIVRESYKDPKLTYETNVIGTVNILECIRRTDCVKSFVNVTTDKVYQNNEWEWGYRENEVLNGYDPYSNSKSCSELVTQCYKRSFLSMCPVSTARAGNVIGGGDFSSDRIIPDCVRAAVSGKRIVVRNPYSTRPYQHVLEPLFAYLMIAGVQYNNIRFEGCYNVGPDDSSCFQTGALVDLFIESWGDGLCWENKFDGGPHEASFLKLDCSKIKTVFGWSPKLSLKEAVEYSVQWYKAWSSNTSNIKKIMEGQIDQYLRRWKNVER